MKKLLLFAIAIMELLLTNIKVANADQNNDYNQNLHGVLIVYLSRTGNTEVIAKIIHARVGGKLVALELESPYPENYDAIVKQVAQENESGYLPPLKTIISELETYQTVFIGFPTWGMELPPPVKSFLHHNDLRGKVVFPFNTNAGYGVGSSFDTLKEMCKGCEVRTGFSTRGGIERDGVYLAIKGKTREHAELEVSKWLNRYYHK